MIDLDQKKQTLTITVLLGVVVIAIIVAAALLIPELARISNDIFGEGLGLKDAAIIAFFLSVGLLVLFALVAGDGLLGEVQFLLASYVGMFVINWLLIAWIF
jgi:hypothetical protein